MKQQTEELLEAKRKSATACAELEETKDQLTVFQQSVSKMKEEKTALRAMGDALEQKVNEKTVELSQSMQASTEGNQKLLFAVQKSNERVQQLEMKLGQVSSEAEAKTLESARKA